MPDRVVSVDVMRKAGAFSRAANYAVSASRAYTLLSRRHQDAILKAKRECGFQYLRFHGLFQDDMGIYREDAFGNPIWGWQYVDEVYDFLSDAGIRPFVVLDFMPDALKSGGDTIYWERSNITPPRDVHQWSELVYRTVSHFAERYGEEEVASWFFEVWNEPDGFFFKGSKADYLALYRASAEAVKRVSPRFRVGGPSVAGDAGWISSLIAYCAQNGVPLDFISGHTYALKGFASENTLHPEPGIPVWQPGTPWKLGNGAYDPAGSEQTLLSYRSAITSSALPSLPLYITEFGLSYDYWDPLRDSYEAASYLLSRLHALEGKALCFSTCEISDIFEEDGPPTQSHFHGGFGLLNLQNIPKPAYFAYRFLHALSDTRLVCASPDVIACGGGHGAELLFWDASAAQTADNKHYFNTVHPPKKAADAKVHISSLSPGDYRLTLTFVGYRKNDAYTLFLDIPKKDSLSRAEVEWLRNQVSGLPAVDKRVKVGENGIFSLTVPMEENDVCLLTLHKI